MRHTHATAARNSILLYIPGGSRFCDTPKNSSFQGKSVRKLLLKVSQGVTLKRIEVSQVSQVSHTRHCRAKLHFSLHSGGVTLLRHPKKQQFLRQKRSKIVGKGVTGVTPAPLPGENHFALHSGGVTHF
jgi:hypothetical protein